MVSIRTKIDQEPTLFKPRGIFIGPSIALNMEERNLGRVFKFIQSRPCIWYAIALTTKATKLKVENSAQTTYELVILLNHANSLHAKRTDLVDIMSNFKQCWNNELHLRLIYMLVWFRIKLASLRKRMYIFFNRKV